MQPRVFHVVLSLFLLVATACGGAYGAAVERGDKYAAAGHLDAAAAEYERAIAMKPDKPEAKIKLEQIRQRQAYQHVKRARALEDRGEVAAALVVVHEALALSPEDVFVHEELSRLEISVIDRAQARMDADDPGAALELTTLVLKASPRHPRAGKIDRAARVVLSNRAYERGEGFMEREFFGNALVELTAATTYRRDFAHADFQRRHVRSVLQNELAFVARVRPFTAIGPGQVLAREVSVEALQRSIDERLLLQVAPDDPSPGAPGERDGVRPGVRLTGQFSGYSYQHDQHNESRSCDYVCGTDYQPNPDRATAESDLSRAESDLNRAESDVAGAERQVLDQEREIARLQEQVDRAQSERDKAQQSLDRCEERASEGDSRACSSERSRLQSEQRDLASARDRLRPPRDRLDSARRSLDQVRERRNREREEVERERQRFRDTPETIAIDRYCPFDYQVAVHDVVSRISMNLTVERMVDGSAILQNEPFQYRAAGQDQTFQAISGRCSSVAGGDPLQLPSEGQLRAQLAQQIVDEIRARLMASYDVYRAGFLAEARKHESAGLTEQAVEAYVRYVLTSPHDLQDAEAIGQFLQEARGFGALDAL